MNRRRQTLRRLMWPLLPLAALLLSGGCSTSREPDYARRARLHDDAWPLSRLDYERDLEDSRRDAEYRAWQSDGER